MKVLFLLAAVLVASAVGNLLNHYACLNNRDCVAPCERIARYVDAALCYNLQCFCRVVNSRLSNGSSGGLGSNNVVVPYVS